MPRTAALLLSLLLGLAPVLAQAEDHTQHETQPAPAATSPLQPVEHIELNLPKSLLPELPAISGALTLDQAVELGLKQNLGIQVARSNVDISRAMLRGARAERWPVISVGSLTFVRTEDNQTLMTPDMMMNTTGENDHFFQDLNATARVPLFTGGRIVGSIRAARFALEGSEAAQRQTIVDTAYRIKEAYLTAMLSLQEHLVHQQHIDVQEALLKNVEARYRVGRGLKADVLRVQTEIADARRMLNEQHARLNNTVLDLKSEMAVDLGSDVKLTSFPTLQPWNGPSLEDAVKQATITHPRVLEAQSREKEAGARITVARSRYFPEVYGQVTGNLRFPDEPPMMGNGVIGLVTASLPLLDRSRGAEVSRYRAEVARAEQEVKAARLEVAKNVSQAWNDLTFARINAGLADAAVTQAAEDLRLIQRRQAVGRAIIVEVQDAAQQLRQAQLNKAQAIYNHELAKARLLQAIGQVQEGGNP
jgi:outer membrane protein